MRVGIDDEGPRKRSLASRVARTLLQRFIGAIYRPDTELQSHYARTSVSRHYDGYVWFDETHAVHALGAPATKGDEVPETSAFGL